VWVSEIMLQQTRIETVVGYYRRFLRRFPDVRALARAELGAVLKAWEGMGYYARARNLHRGARVIAGGRWPRTAAEWADIPGVGPYTAAAIASITAGEPVPVVDGNVRRVVARILGEPRPAPDRMSAFLHEALDRRAPGDFNQAIMELGQTVCVPRTPHCPECPVRACCRGAASTASALPTVRTRQTAARLRGAARP